MYSVVRFSSAFRRATTYAGPAIGSAVKAGSWSAVGPLGPVGARPTLLALLKHPDQDRKRVTVKMVAVFLSERGKPQCAAIGEVLEGVPARRRCRRVPDVECFRITLEGGHRILEPVDLLMS